MMCAGLNSQKFWSRFSQALDQTSDALSGSNKKIYILIIITYIIPDAAVVVIKSKISKLISATHLCTGNWKYG